MTVSKETAHRLTLTVGGALVEAEDAAVDHLFATSPEPTATPVEHQQISVDGAFIPLIGEWAEVKTVAIGTIHQGKDGPKATDLSYFSRLADHQRFSRQATLETHRRATDRATQVTAVVDGADWIQEMLDLHCPRATRVLDWAHGSSYISGAAQALFREAGQAADWRAEQLNRLMHGDPEDVLVALCEGLTGCILGSEEEATIRASLGYLARRSAQIQYCRFREAGLPIGSGIVESANKLVMEVRLKGAGMRWLRTNADPMLALRATVCSANRWATTWALIERYRLRRCAESARAAHDAKHPPPPLPTHTRKRRPFREFSLHPSRRPAKT